MSSKHGQLSRTCHNGVRTKVPIGTLRHSDHSIRGYCYEQFQISTRIILKKRGNRKLMTMTMTIQIRRRVLILMMMMMSKKHFCQRWKMTTTKAMMWMMTTTTTTTTLMMILILSSIKKQKMILRLRVILWSLNINDGPLP